jgi:hypothetical protein
MFANIILAAVLLVSAEPVEKSAPPQLSTLQKAAKMAPLVSATTECVINAVNNDPRNLIPGSDLGDMIIAAFAGPCHVTAQDMVDSYDRYFGYGRGEKFLMGPYLDVLPITVQDARKKAAGPLP